MTVEQMKAVKKEYGLSYEIISQDTGIPYSTVSKIMMGVTKAPRRDTVRRLTAYFQQMQGGAGSDGQGRAGEQEALNRAGQESDRKLKTAGPEGQMTEKGRARVTIGQRDALPNARRTELIDGVLYDLLSPSPEHQDLMFLIGRQLGDCLDQSPSGCHMFMAPLDVVLSESEPTVLQPDLVVIGDKDRFRNGKYYGAPRLVIEVLSPSSRRRDVTVKMRKYTDAGVSEYWMVDSAGKKVIVCDLEVLRDESRDGDIEYLYGFDGKVPLLCSGGRCSVDFDVIRRRMEDYFGT